MLTTYLSTGGWRRKGSRRRRLRRGAGCRGGRHPWVPAAARSVASGSGQRGPWMRSAEAEVPGGTTRRLGGSWRETGREEAGGGICATSATATTPRSVRRPRQPKLVAYLTMLRHRVLACSPASATSRRHAETPGQSHPALLTKTWNLL